MIIWSPTRSFRTSTQKRCPFHHTLECKSRKSRDTCSNRLIWPWCTEWSRAKANRVFPRERAGHNNHPFPTTQEMTQHTDISRWSTPKSDCLYSLQPKMEKIYTALGSKITADGACSHEIKRHLLLGRKAITNLDSILKSTDITLPVLAYIVKVVVFPVVVYGCKSWTIKKTECRRIDAFEIWCWRRFLGVHWTARRSNQTILKEISPEYSLEGLMLRLKLQYFGHLMQRTNSLEKPLILGKIEGRRRRGRQRMRWLDDITDSMDISLSNSGR